MRHEERHALGLWLIAAVLGGFAVAVWAARVLRPEPEREPVHAPSTALGAPRAQPPIAAMARFTSTGTIARRHSGSTVMFSSG